VSVAWVSNKLIFIILQSERNCTTRRFSLVLNAILEEATVTVRAAHFQTGYRKAPGSVHIYIVVCLKLSVNGTRKQTKQKIQIN
jgi:uncharacterized membrane protein YhfC